MACVTLENCFKDIAKCNYCKSYLHFLFFLRGRLPELPYLHENEYPGTDNHNCQGYKETHENIAIQIEVVINLLLINVCVSHRDSANITIQPYHTAETGCSSGKN
jgi:hypothetical protein